MTRKFPRHRLLNNKECGSPDASKLFPTKFYPHVCSDCVLSHKFRILRLRWLAKAPIEKSSPLGRGVDRTSRVARTDRLLAARLDEAAAFVCRLCRDESLEIAFPHRSTAGRLPSLDADPSRHGHLLPRALLPSPCFRLLRLRKMCS